LYLHMEASQHSLLAACFTLHSINATLAVVPQRGAGLWMTWGVPSDITSVAQIVDSVGLQTTVARWKYTAGLWWPRSENSGQNSVILSVPIRTVCDVVWGKSGLSQRLNRGFSILWYTDTPSLPVREKCSCAHCSRSIADCTVTTRN
jgi:hypothetical protein